MVFTFYFNTFTGHLQNQQLLKEINQDCKHKIPGSDSRHSGFAIHILYIHRWGSVCLPLCFCNYTSIINTSDFKGHLKWDMKIDSTVPFKCKSNHLRSCSHGSKLCFVVKLDLQMQRRAALSHCAADPVSYVRGKGDLPFWTILDVHPQYDWP